MGGATRTFYFRVLEEALGILRAAGADHLVMGSIAVRRLLGKELSEDEDIDILVRRGDAERLLPLFAAEGYTTYRRDETWIYKAARPDVTVDLIFRAGETIELDAEHLSRARVSEGDGLRLLLPSAEDLAVMKAVFDGVDRRGGWYDAVEIIRRYSIDWDYLTGRGIKHAPRRVLALLLYAVDAGVVVPDEAVARLGAAARRLGVPAVTFQDGSKPARR